VGVREKYNFGGDSERSNLRSSVNLWNYRPADASAAAATSLITFIADRPGHDFRYAIDASKARRELGGERAKALRADLSAQSAGISTTVLVEALAPKRL